MEKRLILRGVIAGAVGGVLAFLFVRIFAEPLIQQAIDYAGGRDEAQRALDNAPGGAEMEVFSRTIQENIGAGVALILFGVAMGALFAVVYATCLGRVGRVRAPPLAVLVAGAAFVAVYLVPFLKYPSNPPSVGNADTIRLRSA